MFPDRIAVRSLLYPSYLRGTNEILMPLLWDFDVRIDDFFARSRTTFSRMAQHFIAPLAALALILIFEGTSAAKTQAEMVPATQEASHASSPAAAESAAPATKTFSVSSTDRDLANSALAARIRICHISRHPRDGMPPEEHACPLFIAEAVVPTVAAPVALRVD